MILLIQPVPGKFVYVDNTQNIICLFYLNEHGKIELVENTPVENGGMVRGMGISPDGRYLIITGVSGEKADVFSIEQNSGHLSHVSSIDLPTPTAVAFKVYGGSDD